jgi:hypothetical protein
VNDQSPRPQASRQGTLASFDQARDTFLAAFAQAPDEALTYVPPGDEYALGVLPIHLQDPMRRYMRVLDRMIAGAFALVDLGSGPDAAARIEDETRFHAYLVAQRPTGADRAGLLDDLVRAHQQVTTRVAALDEAAFEREAPVMYSAGSEPYPTSCRAIMGWLTDHYHEHTDQALAILAQWRAR